MKLKKIKLVLALLLPILAICSILSGLTTCGWLSKLLNQNHSCLATLNSGEAARVLFSPNGQLIATQSYGYNLKLWQADDYQLLNQWRLDASPSMVFTPDSEQIVMMSSNSSFIGYWHLEQERFTDAFDVQSSKFALSPDGSIVAAGRLSETLLWQVHNQQIRRVIEEIKLPNLENKAIEAISFSPNGNLLASGRNDGTLRIWEVDSGRLLRTMKGHVKSIDDVAFSPDSRLLAASASNIVKLWQVSDGAQIHTLTGHSDFIRQLVFTPDGQFLASSGDWDGTVRIWRVEDGQLVRTLRLSWAFNAVWDVAISPDGKTLAASKRYGSVYLFDLQKLLTQ